MYNDLDGFCIKEDSALLLDLRGDFGSYVTKHYPWKT